MRIPGIPYIQGRNSYPDADGTKYGVAIHNTSNTATAAAEARYATRRTDGISAHFYVDDEVVIQSLDTDARAGHAGSSEGNQHAIAVEITGVNAWTRQQWLDRVAWDKLGAVLAVVCRRYGIAVRRATVDEMRANPRVRAFYSHDDMRRAWGGTTHTDPGPGFPWDRLFAAITAAGTEEAGIMAGLTDEEQQLLARRVQDLWYSVGRYVPVLDQPDRTEAITYAWPRLVGLVQEIARRVDIDDGEVARIAAAVPQPADAEEIVQGVLDGLGHRPVADVAETLRAVYEGRPEQLAQLVVLLGGTGTGSSE
jgi:N-acetyl-anhydromuramyl-L-alanine amidase AmpD